MIFLNKLIILNILSKNKLIIENNFKFIIKFVKIIKVAINYFLYQPLRINLIDFLVKFQIHIKL